jgi:hypothetical protein
LLENIRTAPAVQRDFPDVKLTTLRISKSTDPHGTAKAVTGDPATLTVTCLPKAKGGAAPAAAAGKDGAPANHGGGSGGGGSAMAKSE